MSSVNPSPILTHATLKFFLTQLRTDTNELAYHIGIQVAVNTRGCGQMPSNPGVYWYNLTILLCLRDENKGTYLSHCLSLRFFIVDSDAGWIYSLGSHV